MREREAQVFITTVYQYERASVDSTYRRRLSKRQHLDRYSDDELQTHYQAHAQTFRSYVESKGITIYEKPKRQQRERRIARTA